MAAKPTEHRRWEKLDKERLSSAVREIGRTSNLRFFLRTILGSSGVLSILPSDNALAMARAAGRHELGMEIIATLNETNPRLWPQLLLEEANETLERLQPDGYTDSERGQSGDDSADGDTADRY